MKVTERPLSDVKPYEKNAKKHSTKQVKKIADSIQEFGFNQPIVVDKDGVIIAGHGRYLAAKLLGLEKAPVLQVDITEEKAMAYRLADNKLNESPWDVSLVLKEIPELEKKGINVELTGFTRAIVLDEKRAPRTHMDTWAEFGRSVTSGPIFDEQQQDITEAVRAFVEKLR